MKRAATLFLLLIVGWVAVSVAQVSGNLGFSESGAKNKAVERENTKRNITKDEQPPSPTATYIEADVLMNVVADEFVAVFGLSQEGATPEECSQKMDATVKEFTEALVAMKINKKDLFLDYVTQTKIYGFEVMGEVAREKLVGFELKKNLSIRYTDRLLIDKLAVVAAKSKIYDLIKVDYVVRDIEKIQDKLMATASNIIQAKTVRYEKLLGIKLQPPAQIYAEKYATHYPTAMYDSYTAAESQDIEAPAARQRQVVLSARKTRTFVFNALDSDGFDQVINPVVTEPVVQFTLYLKIKYEVEQLKAK